ncbi:methyltransferase domain-containing protein [Nodosilinea sp. PGN35]|uniref:methyltransferase domain-containing protein n=1 Tax=Nodosilinea sp. PGN35 TaxID=3020489 RepID=UPI0023B2298F|nr:methyltransferase domain-containing protein [Nodosilinea sp. TSF1-S3]MDF0367335.1 methyltransferase domain-containing protein [Nodosilinea sp. TSF1-S3]
MQNDLGEFRLDPSASPLPRWKRWILPSLQRSPQAGRIKMGDLRRLSPISRHFGYDRGLPVDRYYIENFLKRYSQDIQGRVLEIGDDSYTRKFGENRVTTRDVLHVKEGNSIATFVGDLTNADHLPSDAFDCFILTQTLHLVYDFRTALETIYRILKPGGVVLTTVPGISHKSIDEWEEYWCWAFTTASCRKLFAEFFPPDHVEVEAFGNVLTAIAFLEGLSFHELTKQELDHRDRSYEVLITIRAVKPSSQP